MAVLWGPMAKRGRPLLIDRPRWASISGGSRTPGLNMAFEWLVGEPRSTVQCERCPKACVIGPIEKKPLVHSMNVARLKSRIAEGRLSDKPADYWHVVRE
jgi:hypothetical protein